jgi:uncharacterized protein (TIGR00251 family)
VTASAPIRSTKRGICLTLHVQPRARRTEPAGRHGDALKLRIAAPPVDGAANQAIVEFLAAALRVPRAAVTIVSGAGSRRKIVEVAGVDVEQARRGLGLGEAG